jgi:hypothetical protein
MKTLQRQNTKREIVKKVRFQKNELSKGAAAVEKEKGGREREIDKLKGQTIPMQYSNGSNVCATDAAVSTIVATPVPVPANFESSALISNLNAVNRIDDEGTNEEENIKEPRDAITLSLVE